VSYQGYRDQGPQIRQAGKGGGLEASEGLSVPPGGLKHGLEQKGSPKYLRGYRFQNDLTLNVGVCPRLELTCKPDLASSQF
jgi:hypothetical protein